jgi:hypothetical protein
MSMLYPYRRRLRSIYYVRPSTVPHESLSEDITEQSKSLNEHNDCTVVALSVAAGISYQDAHRMLSDAGRKPRRGFKFSIWLNNQCFMARMKNTEVHLGKYKVQSVRMGNSITLAKLLRDFPRGRFIARKRKHVFVVVDGKVYNLCSGARTLIKNLWYLTEAES